MNDPFAVFPRAARLRARNLRSLKDLDIPLGPLTVLIGDSGSGKTTVIEALRVLSTVTTLEPSEARHVLGHRMLREDAGGGPRRASVEVVIDAGPGQPRYCYGVVLGLSDDLEVLIEREGIREVDADRYRPVRLRDEIDPSSPYRCVRELLQGVIARPDRAEPTDLDLSFLLNQEPAVGSAFAEHLRLGIGSHLVDVGFDLIGSSGPYAMWNPRHPDTVATRTPISELSRGERAYVRAVAQLLVGNGVIALDSPDQGLRPAIAERVAHLADTVSERRQVIIATHSDALLDALYDPRCVLQLERNHPPTRVDMSFYEHKQRPYLTGLGAIRRDGYGTSLFAVEEPRAWPGPSILEE